MPNKLVQNGTTSDRFLCETCNNALHRKGAGGEWQIICEAAKEREVRFRVVECNSFVEAEDARNFTQKRAEQLFWPTAWQIVITDEGPLRLIPPGLAIASGMRSFRHEASNPPERAVKIAKLEVFDKEP
jgi:hypothetical protein